jgi:hypothetical protein
VRIIYCAGNALITLEVETMKRMTDKEYKQLCKDIKSDIMSDCEGEINDSIYYDVAEGVLFTEERVKEYLIDHVGVKPDYIYKEIIADDIASAGR